MIPDAVCYHCKFVITKFSEIVFKDGHWSHRTCDNRAQDEAREAHIDTPVDQYKRDKMRMEIDDAE